jgi:Helix-turn-helix domain
MDVSGGDGPELLARLRVAIGRLGMSDDYELVRGSGNVFRDFGDPNVDLEQVCVTLAARIIRTLDGRMLSTREAENLTGVAHTEFSRIRNVKLNSPSIA